MLIFRFKVHFKHYYGCHSRGHFSHCYCGFSPTNICQDVRFFDWICTKYGAIHKWRHQFFLTFWPLPPPCHQFYLIWIIILPSIFGDVIYGWLLTLQKHHCALKNAFYEVSWVFEFLFGNQNPPYHPSALVCIISSYFLQWVGYKRNT